MLLTLLNTLILEQFIRYLEGMKINFIFGMTDK